MKDERPQFRQLEQEQHKGSTPTPLQTELAGIQSALTAAGASLTSIAAGVLALDALIQSLQNTPGTLDASDQAALDAIALASANLATQAAAISTVAPGGTPLTARHP